MNDVHAYSKAKGKQDVELKARADYRMDLIAERLTGRAEEHYVSNEMMWGVENEKYAKIAYEITQNEMLDNAGLVLHPAFDFSGASPDALVGSDGCLECKCPKTTTHLRWMEAGEVPEEHQLQMLWVMTCCERQWCDFLSYDPRLPEGLRVFLVRLTRDDERIRSMEAEVNRFNGEIESSIAKLKVNGLPPTVFEVPQEVTE